MFPFTQPVEPPLPNCRVPALIVVPPVNVSELVRTSVPLPTTASAPGPLIRPPIVSVLPCGSNVAVLLAPMAILRFAARANEPPACKVLSAAKVMLVEGEPGTAPKAASLPIESMPWLSVVPPENELLPVKASVPLPILIKAPPPERLPE